MIGWQLYDPATGAFLQEGEWSEMTGRDADLRITLPAEEGAYRVQVAPVKDRARFIRDRRARWDAGKLEIGTPRVLTASSVRRARLLRAVPKAFRLPARSVWRNRKLIGSMVRRDILSRYRGSFGGTLWTFLNPLLLMATYFFVFGVVLRTRSEPTPAARVRLVFPGRDAAVAGVFGSRGPRALRDSGISQLRQEDRISAGDAAGEPGDLGRGHGGVRAGDFHGRAAVRCAERSRVAWSGCRCC